MMLIPEEPFDIDEVCDAHRATATSSGKLRLDRRGGRGGRCPKEGTHASSQSAEVDAFGHARLGGIGDARGRARSRSAPAIETRVDHPRPRPARRHARPRSTGCWPPASASPPSTPCTTARGARWWPCRPARSCGCRWPRRSATLKIVDPELYHASPGLLRASRAQPGGSRRHRWSRRRGRRGAVVVVVRPAGSVGSRPGDRLQVAVVGRAPRSACRRSRNRTLADAGELRDGEHDLGERRLRARGR